jgi:DNA-nicking Smr family endonuclease
MAKRHDPAAGPDELDADLLTEPLTGEPAAAPFELTDTLDLHHFLPRECADLVTDYLDAARAAGLPTVRLIHGKGAGTLRRAVHAVLDRHPAVRAYRLADDRSSWGATLVELHPPAER